MFTKIKEFFVGKPNVDVVAPGGAPYKVEAPWTHAEVAPVTAPIVAESEPSHGPVPIPFVAVAKAAPVAKAAKPAAKPKKPAARKPAAKKPV